MKTNLIVGMLIGILSGTVLPTSAQFAPRSEDHFWRRKVVNKIDLTEKINQPIVMKEADNYKQYHQGQEKRGLVTALMEALKANKISAYSTDSLDKQMDYTQVLALLNEAKGVPAPSEETDPEEDIDDTFGSEFYDMEDPEGTTEPAAPLGEISFGGDEYAPLENYIMFVEDRIFDKNRADMVYDIQYIQLYYVDPGGILRDRAICTFKYNEAMTILEETQWKNKFNDAEYRNMREMFELRLFNSYIVNVSNINYGVQSLEEAAYRKEQIVEYEHHLWSY